MNQVFADAKCSLSTELGADGIMRSQAEGFLTLGAAKAWVNELNAALEKQPTLFLANDWWSMKGYEGESRELLTEYFSAQRKRIKGSVLLTNSAMILMGTNTAGLVLRALGVDVRATRERAVFEEWVRAEVTARAA